MDATLEPTKEPTLELTMEPTLEPTMEPTLDSTMELTLEPTMEPTLDSTMEPTLEPTMEPTLEPTMESTLEPTMEPLQEPVMESETDDIIQFCIPGMRVSVANDEFISGPGTNEVMGYIYATVAGFLKLTIDEQTKMTRVSVESPKRPSMLPKPGDVVTGRVTVVNPRLVYCNILCVNDNVLSRSYKGIIKKEDIMGGEGLQIDSYKCFRPGDIIMAKVLPMKEIHYYLLSTAEHEFGVVIAKAEGSPVGVNMVPTSWSEMQCPKTLVKEKRKVAKVIPEKLNQTLSQMALNSDVKVIEENGDVNE